VTRFIVLKQQPGDRGPHVYGPIEAPDPGAAVERLADGSTHYLATGRGRYHAIELRHWQAGTWDYTKGRGLEKVET
jgi:hypothetical protein